MGNLFKLSFCLWLLVVSPAVSAEIISQKSRYVPMYGMTEQPIGHRDFCNRYPAECKPDVQVTSSVSVSQVGVVNMTAPLWKQLRLINEEWNVRIRPDSDQKVYGTIEFWGYPQQFVGDCEDYVLQKRRMLMRLGWPQSALLITVVRDENYDGHAILTVRTSRGDYILDNKNDRIIRWYRSRYDFVKVQSPNHPGQWFSTQGSPPNLK